MPSKEKNKAIFLKVLNNLLGLIDTASRRNQQNNEAKDDSTIFAQRRKQMIRQILPSVRKETVVGTENMNWKQRFWLASEVAVLLAILLLAVCCCNWYQSSKRNEYERLI